MAKTLQSCWKSLPYLGNRASTKYTLYFRLRFVRLTSLPSLSRNYWRPLSLLLSSCSSSLNSVLSSKIHFLVCYLSFDALRQKISPQLYYFVGNYILTWRIFQPGSVVLCHLTRLEHRLSSTLPENARKRI